MTPLLVVGLGFWLRVATLGDIPPGWRDDEVIETTVHARQVLDGQWPIVFVEGEGHEPLYHYASAAAIAALGAGLFQVRLVSAAFGILSLAANHRLARGLFGRRTADLATLALAVSFWSLMYSRTKIRHVSMLVFMLLTLHFLLQPLRRPLESGRQRGQSVYRSDLLAGLFLGAGLYTYFASRVVPVIVLALAGYLLLFRRDLFLARWRGLLASLVVAGTVSLPLVWAIVSKPGIEQRLEVVGGPLTSLLHGDWGPALNGTAATLGIFAWTGDPEALYNLPGRPVFGPIAAFFFAVGLLTCLRSWRQPHFASVPIWLVIGMAPGFVSLPAASLGHTIAAQPAFYLLAVLGLLEGGGRLPGEWAKRHRQIGMIIGSVLLIGTLAARDLRDYFYVWPRDGYMRSLYRADLHEAARWLRLRQVETPVAISGRLSLWDARAFRLERGGAARQARWFNPERALLVPSGSPSWLVFLDSQPQLHPALRARLEALMMPGDKPVVGDHWRAVQLSASALANGESRAFSNGLELLDWELLDKAQAGRGLRVIARWRVSASFRAEPPGLSGRTESPPQPTNTFVHLLAPGGDLIAGDDRFDVDGYTLQPGDTFYQLYSLPLPSDLAPGSYSLSVGQYDPVTGARVPVGGADNLLLGRLTVNP